MSKILTDEEKHKLADSADEEIGDMEGPLGSEPATGSDDTSEDSLKIANDMGLYSKTSDDNGKPEPVAVDEQEFKDELKHLRDT